MTSCVILDAEYNIRAYRAVAKTGGESMRTETVPNFQAIWQSDNARTYRCMVCMRPVYSTYEGDAMPEIECTPTKHKPSVERGER